MVHTSAYVSLKSSKLAQWSCPASGLLFGGSSLFWFPSPQFSNSSSYKCASTLLRSGAPTHSALHPNLTLFVGGWPSFSPRPASSPCLLPSMAPPSLLRHVILPSACSILGCPCCPSFSAPSFFVSFSSALLAGHPSHWLVGAFLRAFSSFFQP